MWPRAGFHRLHLLAAGLTAAPGQALAQAPEGGLQIGDGLLLALGVMIGAIVMTAWALWHRQIALDRSLTAEAALRFDHLLLEEGPASYMAVHADGAIICSDRVREWLDLSRRPDTLADLRREHGLEEAGEALCEAIDTLHEEDLSFSMIFRSSGSGVPLYVVGRRLRIDEAETSLGVIAFTDISGLEADRVDLLKDLQEADGRRALLEASLDAAPFPVWLRNRKLDLVWVNRAYVEATDATSAEAVLQGQQELTGPGASAPGRELARMAKLGDQPIFDTHYVVVGNQRRSLKIFEVPHGGGEAGLVGFALDETELEKSQTDLKAYAESHAETLDRLSTAIAIFGADQTLQFYNRAFVDLWRLGEAWLAGNPAHGELLETLREKRRLPEQADFLSWKQAALDQYTALPEPVEEMWHLPDGRALRVATQPHPMGGLLLIFEDVTDRLALERSYNTLIAVQQATLDNLREGVAVVGSDGRLRLSNRSFAETLQLDAELLETSPHISDLLEECRGLFETGDRPWKEMKAEIKGYTINRQPALGRWALTTGETLAFAVVALPDGATLFTIADITDSVRTEGALEERTRALAAAERRIGEIIGGISRELRAPLDSVIALAELLRDEYLPGLDDRQKSTLGAALQSSEVLRQALDDMIQLSQLAAEKRIGGEDEIPLADLLASLEDAAKEGLAGKDILLRFEPDQSAACIAGDSAQIEKAMRGILSQFVAQIKAGSTLEIRSKNAGRTVDIEFRAGRAAPDLKHLESTLGMTLNRHIITSHGGRLEIDQESCAIRCRLPHRRPATKVEDAPQTAAS